MWTMDRERQIYNVTLVGSAGNVLLVIAKFIAGILGHSSAMIADAVHSLSDFVTPGPADYPNGIIGGFLPNFPSFRDGVALGPFLKEKFGVPVFINNDGDLYAYGEALGGALPEINAKLAEAGSAKRYHNLIGYTFGTGFGVGTVIDGRLNRGRQLLRGNLLPEAS